MFDFYFHFPRLGRYKKVETSNLSDTRRSVFCLFNHDFSVATIKTGPPVICGLMNI